MLNLTNNQLKYLAYGAIGLILIVLVLNIFLTKINNNYNNSTFESFGNMREGMDNKKDKDALDTTLSSSKENVKNISKHTLEKFKKIFILNEVEYLNDIINENSKTRIDIKNLLSDKNFINRVNNMNSTFEYLDNVIKNF